MTLGILLVDPQNDFFPGGALGVDDGNAIVTPINALLEQHAGAPVFVTRDWHPQETKHFQAGGGIWPPHCVQGSEGAAFHKDLAIPDGARVYEKGTDPNDDGGYSAFDGHRVVDNGEGPPLLADLKDADVDTLIVAGLATDYCVKASVLGALENGLNVFLFLPGVRAVNLKPTDGQAAIDEMRDRGAHLVTA